MAEHRDTPSAPSLESHADPVAILDQHGVIVFVNPAWREFASAFPVDGRGLAVGAEFLVDRARSPQCADDILRDIADAVKSALAGAPLPPPVAFSFVSRSGEIWMVPKITGFDEDGKRYAMIDLVDITLVRRSTERTATNDLMEKAVHASITVPVAVIDDQGRVMDANAAYVRDFGFADRTLGERGSIVSGRSVRRDGSWLAAGDHPAFLAMAQRRPVSAEIGIIGDDGALRWFLVNAEPLGPPSDPPVGAVLIFVDITQRVHGEEAVKDGEKKFRMLFDSLDQAAGILDVIEDASGQIIDFRIVDVNQAYGRHTGRPSGQVIGKRLWELFPTMDNETMEALSRVARTGDAEVREYFAVSIQRYVRLHVNSPRQGRLALIFEDISHRKGLETQLHESEHRYRTLFDEGLDGIVMLDANGRAVQVNAAFAAMHGYTVDELVGTAVSGLVAVGSAETYRARLASVLAGERTRVEVEHRCKNADVITLEVSASRISLGGSPFVLQFHRDVTARKQGEEQIQSMLKAKELLLREVHHRIKNNMSVIGSILSLQGFLVKDAAAREVLKDCEKRVTSMAMLYDKLYRSVSVTELSARHYLLPLIDAILKTYPTADRVQVTTVIDDAQLTSYQLWHLGIILNELISNTMKHAFTGREKGEIVVRCAVEEDRYTLRMRDNGVGLSEEIDLETAENFGLRLVALLTEQLGGKVSIQRNEGTAWTISCPR